MPEKATPAWAPSAKKRVLIVDDHPVFRAGLTGLVNLEDDLMVCGEASDAAQAMHALEELRPDVVLMDMSLPGKSGLDVLKDIGTLSPQTLVLIISMHDETLYAERVIRAGGRGYLMKVEGPDKIILAIRKILSGGISVSDRVASQILHALSGSSSSQSPASALTDREFAVFRLLGHGKDPHEIARVLHLSIKTVDTHRHRIGKKLGLRNATELIHHATRWFAAQT
jgi:DNA-binding NarL/FixJ family response regulator